MKHGAECSYKGKPAKLGVEMGMKGLSMAKKVTKKPVKKAKKAY